MRYFLFFFLLFDVSIHAKGFYATGQGIAHALTRMSVQGDVTGGTDAYLSSHYGYGLGLAYGYKWDVRPLRLQGELDYTSSSLQEIDKSVSGLSWAGSETLNGHFRSVDIGAMLYRDIVVDTILAFHVGAGLGGSYHCFKVSNYTDRAGSFNAKVGVGFTYRLDAKWRTIGEYRYCRYGKPEFKDADGDKFTLDPIAHQVRIGVMRTF